MYTKCVKKMEFDTVQTFNAFVLHFVTDFRKTKKSGNFSSINGVEILPLLERVPLQFLILHRTFLNSEKKKS